MADKATRPLLLDGGSTDLLTAGVAEEVVEVAMLNLTVGTARSVEGRSCIDTYTGKVGHAVYGPYEIVSPGAYEVQFNVQLLGDEKLSTDPICAVLDIVSDVGKHLIARKELYFSQLLTGRQRFRLAFETETKMRLEYRVWVSGKCHLRIDDYRRLIDVGREAETPADDGSFPAVDLETASFFKENLAQFRQLYELGVGVRLQDDAVVLTAGGLSFYARMSDDLNFVHEVFFENAYNFLVDEDCCVIDIGMNIGLSALTFAAKQNVREVHAYEPFASTYDRAIDNISLNRDIGRKISTYPYGLLDKNWLGELMIGGGTDSGAQSIVAGVSGSAVSVQLKNAGETLGPIIDRAYAAGLKIIVKVDCEGSEFKIFESIDNAGLFPKIDAMMVEWHAMFDDKDQNDLIRPLLRHGFLIFDRSPPRSNGFFYAVRM